MDFYVSKELPYQLNMNIKAGLIKICMYLYFMLLKVQNIKNYTE